MLYFNTNVGATLVWPKGSLPARPRPKPPFSLVNSYLLRIGPERSRTRSGEANP